jgi:c(7)-type cytochrome triheme protein
MEQHRTNNTKKRNRVTFVALFFFSLLLTVACSTSTKRLFFDVTPPSAEELAAEARLEALRSGELQDEQYQQNTDQKALFPGLSADNSPRPEVESFKKWEEVLEFLPKDYKKKTDWSAAVEQGLVRPRTGADPLAQLASSFKYDFIMTAEKPKNEAYFPHSAHTAWLGCKNCHMTIYPYKRNPATMKEMRKGVSCGNCHGNVAFSLKQCKRCHLKR